jgi:hypothetical protein
VQDIARRHGSRIPVVFEGRQPADLCTSNYFSSGRIRGQRPGQALLGEPSVLDAFVVADLGRKFRSNVAMVAKSPTVGLGMMTASLLSLLASIQPGQGRFWVCDAQEGPWLPTLTQLEARTDHEFMIIPHSELTQMLEALTAAELGTPTYLFVAGLQSSINREPPTGGLAVALERAVGQGLRLLVWCDSVMALSQAMTRSCLDQVGYKVAGVMSAEHSASYLKSMAAARIDGRYQAVFVDVDEGDRQTTFRPYALPEIEVLPACLDRIKMMLA